jgi:coenzyme F420-reducing hydrogenase delta subunit
MDGLEKHPELLIFGCARSAGQALALCRLSGQPIPAGVHFVEVPCGGAVATRHLLAAFESGADGVMLCTCHTDNCQSETGNRVAHKRASIVKKQLLAAGVDVERLRISTVAANMGVELVHEIEAFAAEIRKQADS